MFFPKQYDRLGENKEFTLVGVQFSKSGGMQVNWLLPKIGLQG